MVKSSSLFDRAMRCHRAGNFEDASRLYCQVLAKEPAHADAWGNLGTLLKDGGHLEQAESSQRRAWTLAPGNFNFPYMLGNTLRHMGQLSEAIAHYRQSIELEPRFAWAQYNLGLSLDDQCKTGEAEACYRSALTIDPHHYDANLNLGRLLEAKGLLSEAISRYKSAVAHSPERAPAYNNLAIVSQNAGSTADALTIQRIALTLDPGSHRIASNMLFNLQYLPEVSGAALRDSALTYGQRFTARSALAPAPVATGQLRIGYVSADLYSHPVGLFLRHILARHDRARFEIYCYSNGARHDDVTVSLAAGCQWRTIRGVSDEALFRQICEDGIHILVDLSGHSSGNRLPVFALRAAPVQITWLGYFATTGVSTMDFVILDPFHAPAGTEQQFTERIIHLPSNRFCYQPVPVAPEVAAPPFQRNGFITFGSFNNTAKLNVAVLETWASVLRAVPNSRLILKWRTLADASYRERLGQFFESRGIEKARLELRLVSTHDRLLLEYADLDIALDPFPFSGGYTSCEALWMGVPVVTLPQERVVSRQTWSFLNNIGLPGLAAADVAGYTQLAANLARSPHTLLELRRTLRDKMRSSPLCDVVAFTRLLEEAFFKAWTAPSRSLKPE